MNATTPENMSEINTPTPAKLDDFLVVTQGAAYRINRGWAYRWSDKIKKWVSYRSVSENEKEQLFKSALSDDMLSLYKTKK